MDGADSASDGPGVVGEPAFRAAVDIGTNSFHMVVARVDEHDGFEVIEREKSMVRLGSGGSDMKLLADDAIERGVAALARFRQLAERVDAPISAVATSAVREATNADLFLDRARLEAGVDVEVISGFEEARLIHLGVLQALPVFEQHHLVLDIGGGSTEIVVSHRRQRLVARSLKLGAIRLTQRFLADEPTTSAQVKACRRYIESMVAPVVRDAAGVEIDVAVGSSGTIAAVAAMVQASRDETPPHTWNGFEFTRREIRRVVKQLTKAGTAGERRGIDGLDAKRADIILGGALILDEAMAAFDLSRIQLSDFALREGVLLDAIERARGSARHHLHDLRRQSVLRLAELTDEDLAHALHVATLALELFDGLAAELELDESHRELLEAATLLCNVGLFISHAGHHKHSYYVIRNSEHLLGFNDHEIELIAQVARYHRKSAPKARHPEFAALDGADQLVVRKLAGILRVALALDRTYSGLVSSLDVEVGDPITVVAKTSPDADAEDLDLELFTAGERKGLLEDVLDNDLEVVLDTTVDPQR